MRRSAGKHRAGRRWESPCKFVPSFQWRPWMSSTSANSDTARHQPMPRARPFGTQTHHGRIGLALYQAASDCVVPGRNELSASKNIRLEDRTCSSANGGRQWEYHASLVLCCLAFPFRTPINVAFSIDGYFGMPRVMDSRATPTSWPSKCSRVFLKPVLVFFQLIHPLSTLHPWSIHD